jgi:ABC-type branched-subunit amino acid transport system ATPase component
MTLRVEHLRVSYRGIAAVLDVDLKVEDATCVALIGANGAGKTSTLRGISGLVRHSGDSRIWLDESRLDRLAADRRTRVGIGHVLEGRHIFGGLTVRENLEVAVTAARISTTRGRSGRERALGLFPELSGMLDYRAASLSGGQQQCLAIARALVQSPRVLLLDEPSTGLAPVMVARLCSALTTILDSGVGILLAEQSLDLVRKVATEVVLLSHGSVTYTSATIPSDLNAVAAKAYLGG